MSTDLEIVSNHPEYLIIPQSLPFEDWWAYRHELQMMQRSKEIAEVAVPLHTMDWLYAGENIYNERASQGTAFVQEIMGWSQRTYGDYYYVWLKFQPEDRVPGAGISFYQAVMGLQKEDAIALLEAAVEGGWTRTELRRAVKKMLPEPEEPKVTRKMIEDCANRLVRTLELVGDGERYYVDAEPASELAELVGYVSLPKPLVEVLVPDGQMELDG